MNTKIDFPNVSFHMRKESILKAINNIKNKRISMMIIKRLVFFIIFIEMKYEYLKDDYIGIRLSNNRMRESIISLIKSSAAHQRAIDTPKKAFFLWEKLAQDLFVVTSKNSQLACQWITRLFLIILEFFH